MTRLSECLSICVTLLFTTLVSRVASADPCDAVLASGIWETRNSQSALSDTKDYKNWACNSASASGSYGTISGSVSQSACSNSDNYSSYITSQSQEIKTAAEAVLSTWQQCMDRNRNGSWASMRFGDEFITIELRNHQPKGSEVKAKLILVGAIGECSGANITRIDEKTLTIARIGEEADVVCRRTDIAKSAAVLVSFEDGSDNVLNLRALPTVGEDSVSPKIIQVAVPKVVLNNLNWPTVDDKWIRTFPIRDGDTLGIGHIVEPGVNPKTLLGTPFGYMGNAGGKVSSDAYVTYYFDKPAEVTGLDLYQHTNGVLAIEGFVGDNLNHLVSLGVASDPQARNQGDKVIPNGEITRFVFPSSGRGLIFRFQVTKSALPNNSFGLYQAYPVNKYMKRFRVDF